MVSGKIFLLPVLTLSVTPAQGKEQAKRPAPDASVTRVEEGLLPAVSIVGQPPKRRTIAAEMERLHVPGVSVAVLRSGTIAWAKGYGVTRKDGGAITSDTPFQAGSISKPVTAFAALRLVEKGRLDLDRDVNTQLKGWKLPMAASQTVTLRQLLSHTAGTTVHGFPGYAAGTPIPSVNDVLSGRPPAVTKPVMVDTPPGTLWRYSGGGYTVIQKLIGDATGRPFGDVLRDEVLTPAGMTRSSFAQPLDAAALRDVAWPHDAAGQPVAGGPHVYPELAAAGLWTTPSDLARFAMAVRRAAGGASGALLSPSMAATMLTPVKSDYALGLEVRGEAGSQSFSHGGSNEGYENFLVAYTASGDGAAVMTNGAQGSELASELIRSIAVAYDWPSYRSIERPSIPISPATAAKLAGEYAVPNLGTFIVIADGARLSLSLKPGVSEPLYAMSTDSYFILSQDLVLHVKDDGTTVAGRIVSGPFDLPFSRVH
jgi:CubicO group peptidase (beta-lactamase class C family)